MRRALNAISVKLDGKTAAENTTRRKRMILSNAFTYAIERERLEGNPLRRVDWQAPPTDDEVVPNTQLTKSLIEAVRGHGPRGEHLEVFFGCIYYAAVRPREIAALKDTDCVLPDEPSEDAEDQAANEWGELILAENHPEVASGCTDDGTPYEKRGLKRRAARENVLSPKDVKTPLADLPYSLRHAGVSLWIKAGVEPPEVARRAGHSLAVLCRVCAKILRGWETHANQLIDKALKGDAAS
ncbi:hypothetical protein [Streptomyces sp. NPDC018833]|uniref:hypothetical protein n=1 Tax=Streptomyces sp. NPDC018833 TaxID=3365053 RepID=UPI0037B4DB10